MNGYGDNIQRELIYRVAKKARSIFKCVTPVYVGRRWIHQNVQLFVRSKTGILNVANPTTPKIPI